MHALTCFPLPAPAGKSGPPPGKGRDFFPVLFTFFLKKLSAFRSLSKKTPRWGYEEITMNVQSSAGILSKSEVSFASSLLLLCGRLSGLLLCPDIS